MQINRRRLSYIIEDCLGLVKRQYIRNKKKKINEQHGKFHCRGYRINSRTGVVRRIDHTKARVLENACVVCTIAICAIEILHL